MPKVILFSVLILCSLTGDIEAHGRMTDPPARNTIWREGFDNPKNVDDNALNCGGFSNQWDAHDGKCGVCGDPYQGPLRHQAGYPGGYANGVIGRVYKTGEYINVTVKITANHLGYAQYKICPVNDKNKKVTQSCLDMNPLKDEQGNDKFEIYEQIQNSAGTVEVKLKLPAGLTCSQCVVQWTYTAGNNNGNKQETFVNCADVAITDEGGPDPRPTKKISAFKRREGGATKYDKYGNFEGQWDCDVHKSYRHGEKHQHIYNWCITHCIEVEPRERECPSTHCECYQIEGSKPITDHGQTKDSTLKRRKDGATKYDENRNSQGQWDCDVHKSYRHKDKHQQIYDWCIVHCIEVVPWERECPSTHCKCYQIDGSHNGSSHHSRSDHSSLSKPRNKHQARSSRRRSSNRIRSKSPRQGPKRPQQTQRRQQESFQFGDSDFFNSMW